MHICLMKKRQEKRQTDFSLEITTELSSATVSHCDFENVHSLCVADLPIIVALMIKDRIKTASLTNQYHS